MGPGDGMEMFVDTNGQTIFRYSDSQIFRLIDFQTFRYVDFQIIDLQSFRFVDFVVAAVIFLDRQGHNWRAFWAFPGRSWRQTQDSVGHKTEDKRQKKKDWEKGKMCK